MPHQHSIISTLFLVNNVLVWVSFGEDGLVIASLYQHFIRKPLAVHPPHQCLHSVHCIYLTIPSIQPKSKLVNIAPQVLVADMMKSATYATLQDRPDALNTVGVCHAVHILFGRMIDRPVIVCKIAHILVACVFVCVHGAADVYVVDNRAPQRQFVSAFYRHGCGSAIAFTHSQDNGFALAGFGEAETLVLLFVFFFPANLSFVNLNRTGQSERTLLARLVYPLQHKPCRLLSNTQFL